MRNESKDGARSGALSGARYLVVLALLCLTGVAYGQDAPSVDDFVGHWRLDGSEAHGRQVIERAVGRAVDGMGFIVTDIAAGRLRGKNPLVRNIAIEHNGDHVLINFDNSRRYDTALGQWTPHQTPDGDTARVQHRYHGGALVQLFRTDAGSRRNVFRLQPDGKMRLDVTVQSPQLPRDMHYSVTYRRR